MVFPVALAALLSISVLGASTQDQDDATAEISHEGKVYLLLPKPPEGFTASQQPLQIGGETRSLVVLIARETPGAAVTATIEFRELSDDANRRTALKAYANAIARGMQRNGFKIVDKEIPDIETVDFAKPIRVGFDLEDGEGKPMYLRVRVFFTKIGYHVTVFARDKDELKSLVEWSDKIEPPEDE